MESSWLADIQSPVDPNVFLEMIDVWQSAAEKPLRVPDWKPAPGDEPGLVLSDIPINRSGLAVVGALRKRGVPTSQGYLVRLMHLHELIDQRSHFPDFIRDSEAKDGSIEVSDALMKAAATAKMVVNDDGRGCFDLGDVLAKAQAYKAEEDADSAH